LEVAKLCLRVLTCIAEDFSGSIDLIQLANKWFQSKENGFYTINYSYKKHPELNEEYVNCIHSFAPDGE
jgi:hypothetical protein